MARTKDLLVLFFVMFFLAIVVFATLDFVMTAGHEDVHRQIDKYFGCANVTVSLRLWDNSFTRCNDVNRSVSEQEWALHAFNEVVTYNNAQLSLSIFFCTMLVITFIFCLFVYNNKE